MGQAQRQEVGKGGFIPLFLTYILPRDAMKRKYLLALFIGFIGVEIAKQGITVLSGAALTVLVIAFILEVKK